MSSMGAMYRGHSSHDREYVLEFLYGREAPTRLLQGREGTYCFIEACYVAVYGRDVPTRLRYGRDVPTRLLFGGRTYQATGL